MNIRYKAGTSVKIWKTLFLKEELWESDYNKDCVKKAEKESQLEGINVLIGDLQQPSFLDSWIQKAGKKLT